MGARARQIVSGPVSAALVILMLAGCLFLWIGVPLAWLWIGSQIQDAVSLGPALLITMLGILVTIVLMVTALAWLNRHHAELQARRNRPLGTTSALEVMLVSSAAVALVGFGIWFFVFAGTSPVPLNIGF